MGLQAGDDPAAVRQWPPRRRAIAAVTWSSFLAASVGTMLVFAVLDPQVIIDATQTAGEPWLSRTAIYTLGFFVLWLVAAIAGVLTTVLGGTPPSAGKQP